MQHRLASEGGGRARGTTTGQRPGGAANDFYEVKNPQPGAAGTLALLLAGEGGRALRSVREDEEKRRKKEKRTAAGGKTTAAGGGQMRGGGAGRTAGKAKDKKPQGAANDFSERKEPQSRLGQQTTARNDMGAQTARGVLAAERAAAAANPLAAGVGRAKVQPAFTDRVNEFLGSNFVGENLAAGLEGFNSALAGAADWLLPDVLTPRPVQSALDWYENGGANYSQKADETNRRLGLERAGNLTQKATQAVPYMMMALSGGSALPALGDAAAAVGTGGMLGAAGRAAAQMAARPQFWLSAAQNAGGTWLDARAAGADPLQANAAALGMGLTGAAVENLGGVQTLAPGMGLAGAARAAGEELAEGFVQDALPGLWQKATYRPDAPWWSTTDERAVFNPTRAAAAALDDALVGGLYGGLGALLPQRPTLDDAPRLEPEESGREGFGAGGAPSGAQAEQSEAWGRERGDQAGQRVKADRSTIETMPYRGKKPQVKEGAGYQSIAVAEEAVNNALGRIEQAKQVAGEGKSSLRSTLARFYKQAVGDRFNGQKVTVEGLEFDERPYEVSLNKNAIGKVISDVNLSAEKLAVLEQIEDVVRNARYTGSGEYVPHGNHVKKTIRYDYFETQTWIGGQPYMVAFDVEAVPGANNYRTHRVIQSIEIEPYRQP